MNINYQYIKNNKETILFLHGWGADKNSFNFFSNNLKNQFDILTIDFIGHGQSEQLKYVYTVYDYAVDIFRLIKKLDIKNITIICHSFGARVAILLATIFNIKINKLIVIGGAGVRPRFNIFCKISIYNYKLKKWLNTKLKTNFCLDKYGSQEYKSLDKIGKQTFSNIVNFDEKKYIRLIKCLTLLIWGKMDKSTPLYMGKIYHKLIKNSKLITIEKGDHFCFLQYKDKVQYNINRFLY